MDDYIAMLDIGCLKDGEKISAFLSLPSTIPWCKVTWLFLSALTLCGYPNQWWFLRKIHHASLLCPSVFNSPYLQIKHFSAAWYFWVMLWHIQYLNQLFWAIDCYPPAWAIFY